ncbi:hypothetical protein ACFOY2_44025 [Nonomuraea purpurea]|uniref:GntR family transcriptional regulator n=1 Tax=Nonomuraea purpurea TaxID=1849276 RepID=A0ABV8GNK3_9ACTN
MLKAYRELERDGLVEGRPGMGTFVRQGVTGATLAAHTRLRRDLDRWVREAREAGLDQEDLRALFTVVLTESQKSGPEKGAKEGAA